MTPKRRRGMEPDFLRIPEAMEAFSLGADKVKSLAKECDALIKIDRCTLIKYESLKKYIESFTV